LILIGLVSLLSVKAQGLAQQPNSDFRSTSVMQSSGSALPQAAATGAVLTGSTPGVYAPANAPGRRKTEGNPFGDDNIGDTPDPQEPGEPLGDVLWPLMLLALAYVGVCAFRRRRA